MLKEKIFLAIFSLLCAPFACAQVEYGGMPYGQQRSALRSAKSLPYVVMPRFDVNELLLEDSMTTLENGAFRFAYKMNTDIDVIKDGEQFKSEDGSTVYRIGITSAGAYSLNILFTRFDIPCEAKVFLYTPRMTEIKGSFTCENRLSSGILPISPLIGDSLVIEYVVPQHCSYVGELKVGEVNHDYKGVRAALQYEESYPCQVDVACRSNIGFDQKRAVCAVIVDGNIFCTGVLLNNTSEDGTPYFLSASHCLNRNNAVSFDIDLTKAERSIFYFNYERPYCGLQVKGTTEQSVCGASVVAVDQRKDFVLMKLSDVPPVDYMPYYAGWDASGDVPEGEVYTIHHPGGDIKKISRFNGTLVKGDFYYPSRGFENGNYWKISLWDEGLTQVGSSGCPLFNPDGQVIGGLTGGYSNVSCNHPGEDDFFRLDNSWSGDEDGNSLGKWLDPDESGKMKVDGISPYSNPCERISNVDPSSSFFPSDDKTEYETGTNQSGMTAFAEKFENDKSVSLYGFYFIPFTASFDSENPIVARIYSGKDTPGKLVHEQVLKITTTTINSNTHTPKTSTISSFGRKENYLRLDSVVKLSGNYFISFEIPNGYASSFALEYARQGANTALFKDGTGWKPMTSNPVLATEATLLVSAVAQVSENSYAPTMESVRKESFAYADGDDIVVQFASAGDKKLSIYDLSGRKTEEKQTDSQTLRLKLQKGIYIVKVTTEKGVEVFKMANDK